MLVSPYLRPMRRGESLVFDDGIRGAPCEVGPLEVEVLRALWDDRTAGAAMTDLVAHRGRDAVVDAIGALVDQQLVFETHDQARAAFRAALEHRLVEVPFVDQVELTNICPMRCRFCPRGVPGAMTRPTGRMDLGLFIGLLDQLPDGQAGYRPFELHHLGESLVHPELPAFVRAAADRGLPTELSVNPSLLAPDTARALLDAGLRRLVVSLDGMDDETLVAIRGPAARYSKAEPNLDALLAMVAAMDAPPHVVIQMIDLVRNRHQRDAFVGRWGDLGLPTVTAFVKDLDGDDPDTGMPSARPLSFLCSYPWRSVVVLWDGRVVPCCRDDDARLVLGDLREQSLADIWHGDEARRLRERLANDDTPAGHLCHGCAWNPNEFASTARARHPDTAGPMPLHW